LLWPQCWNLKWFVHWYCAWQLCMWWTSSQAGLLLSPSTVSVPVASKPFDVQSTSNSQARSRWDASSLQRLIKCCVTIGSGECTMKVQYGEIWQHGDVDRDDIKLYSSHIVSWTIHHHSVYGQQTETCHFISPLKFERNEGHGWGTWVMHVCCRIY
jgi:hypothetical protein